MVPSKQPRAASSSPGAPVGVGSSADDGATEPTVPNVVPESSPNDPYAYRHITLENGLCALLVVEKPKSAAERARIDAAKKKAAKKQTTVGANTAPAAPAKAEEPDAEGGPDAESKPATVALAVRVGHWSDPKAVPGLGQSDGERTDGIQRERWHEGVVARRSFRMCDSRLGLFAFVSRARSFSAVVAVSSAFPRAHALHGQQAIPIRERVGGVPQ